jgi:hypothetical protein
MLVNWRKSAMRYGLITIAAALLVSAAHAQDYTSSGYCDPICLEHRGAQDCSFHTLAQCEATRSGLGGVCVANPFLGECARASVRGKAPAGRRVRHRD